MHNRFSVRNFYTLNHPRVVACADVAYAGVTLRGLRLERTQREFRLSTPGRKVRGRWQRMVDIDDPLVREQLTDVLVARYQEKIA